MIVVAVHARNATIRRPDRVTFVVRPTPVTDTAAVTAADTVCHGRTGIS